MKFGISPSPFQWWISAEQLSEWAKTAEDFGYDGIFIPDHYDLPAPPFPSNVLVDAWTTLAYIAAKTTKIKLGSMVSPVPRWVPSQLAKVIAMVDTLSGGRVIAGFGAGYCQNEFLNYAPGGVFDKPDVRFEKFIEGVRIILKLWTEESVTFNGRHYKLVNATLKPKPVQKPHPPIWSGAQRPRMLEATAMHFNGWVPDRSMWMKVSNTGTRGVSGPEEYAIYVRKLKELLKKFGRNENDFTFGVLGEINFDSELVENYRKAGCQYYIVEIGPAAKPNQYITLTKKFAEEIISSFT